MGEHKVGWVGKGWTWEEVWGGMHTIKIHIKFLKSFLFKGERKLSALLGEARLDAGAVCRPSVGSFSSVRSAAAVTLPFSGDSWLADFISPIITDLDFQH